MLIRNELLLLVIIWLFNLFPKRFETNHCFHCIFNIEEKNRRKNKRKKKSWKNDKLLKIYTPINFN